LSPKSRNRLKNGVKILFIFMAFAIVFHKVDIDEVAEGFRKTDPILFTVALLFFNLSKILSSVRLNRYFAILGMQLQEMEALKLYYIGMFYNLFLPGGVGGDGYKIYLLKKAHGKGTLSLVSATLLDRLSGLVPLLMLAALFFLMTPFARISPQLRFGAYGFMLLALPLFYLAQRRFFRSYMPVFSSTLLYGFGVQLLQIVSAWALLRAIGIDEEQSALLFLFLFSSVVAVLPVSIGGVGLRELVFLYGMEQLRLPPHLGVTFAMLFFLITALSSLAGAFLPNPLRQRT
jgi:uncharacterized membrane protein YbhN (UPF0104 family)